MRVFLIFDWLQLVRDFLRMPAEDGAGAPPRQRWPSGNSDPGTTGAVMPKTVKSGVVTKRSTVTVTQDRYLEVKVNVTGERRDILDWTRYTLHIHSNSWIQPEHHECLDVN